jgi:hypothetical protein
MRKMEENQLRFGEINISEIKFNPKSRDDIPKLLMGLQCIYITPEIREEVFAILEHGITFRNNKKVDKNNGRPGMEMWKIFVMGTLRLSLNCDYDRLHELVNEHKTIREMLGHGLIDQDKEYTVQTLRDNVCLLTPEILEQINQVVVQHGHRLVKKKSEVLKTRCDSFVLETDVHYPTDINLLSDAIRKVITLTARLCEGNGITEWRQAKYNLRKIKRLYLRAQSLKRSSSQNQDKKYEREKIIIEAYRSYIKIANEYLEKAEASLSVLRNKMSILADAEIAAIEGFVKHAKRQIDQIKRRVMNGEKIPHNEKVFSIFESYTEWISKGKAGVPVELGVRVCIMEDQYGFILNSRVMEKETDDKVAVNMVAEAKKKFSSLNSCSFDRGFYSPSNKIELSKILNKVILPKKGKLNKTEKEIENAEEFREAKRRHSGVESAINALEVHGLDRCPDNGIDGFKRYVALAVVAMNIHKMGALLLKKRQRHKRRDNRLQKAA